VLAALNAQAGQFINERTYQSLASELHNIAGISAVVWLALFVVLQIGMKSPFPEASKLDILVVATVVSLCFLPFAFTAKVGLLLCSVYACARSQSGEPLRRLGLILLSLTGTLVWGPLILTLFAGALLSLDARLVGSAIGSAVDGNVVAFTSGGKQFLIGIPCSSVHNMSLALVLWTTAAAAFRVRIDAIYAACGLAMVAAMIAINVLRLSLIGVFPQHFAFLHDGSGADLFAWGSLIAAGAIAFFAVDHAVRRQQ
jgi:hypothetical protein